MNNGVCVLYCESSFDPCFLPGTKVTMADGSLKAIEEVEVGEYVLGLLGENSTLGASAGTPGLFPQGGQSQENQSQEDNSQGDVEQKDVSRIHDFTFLTINTLTNQQPNVTSNPNTITGNFVLSSPGTTNGSTIDPADNWPAVTPISANTLSWESDNDQSLINSQNSMNFVISKVTKVFHHEGEEAAKEYLVVKMENGKELEVTKEHLVYLGPLKGQWLAIGRAQVGDYLWDVENNWQKITSIEKVQETTPVYNLGTTPTYNYFANGFLVHNKKEGQDDAGHPCPPECPAGQYRYCGQATWWDRNNNNA